MEHFDLYRLDNVDAKGLEEIGLWDALSNKKGLTFVEWAEKIRPQVGIPAHLLPGGSLEFSATNHSESEIAALIEHGAAVRGRGAEEVHAE